MTKKENPVLVCLDTKTNIAKRYSGKTCIIKLHNDGQWTVEDIEKLRVKPELLLAETDPEAA